MAKPTRISGGGAKGRRTPKGQKRMVRTASMNLKSVRRSSSRNSSTQVFRGTDIVPQWNLFRNIGDNIRRAVGGK